MTSHHSENVDDASLSEWGSQTLIVTVICERNREMHWAEQLQGYADALLSQSKIDPAESILM